MKKYKHYVIKILISWVTVIVLNYILFNGVLERTGVPRTELFLIIQTLCCIFIAIIFKNSKPKDNKLVEKLHSFDFMKDCTDKENLSDTERKLYNIMERLRKLSADILSTTKTVECSGMLLFEDTKAIEETSKSVSLAVNEVAEGNSHVVEMVQKAAGDISDTNEFIRGIDGDIDTIKSNVEKSVMTINDGSSIIEMQKNTISETIDKFNDIQNAVMKLDDVSREIHEIVSTISSISEQTNLLALNAAIEAARAGEAGRGFAVVADEIRKLADNTKRSTSDIESLINNTINEIQYIVEVVQRGSEMILAQRTSIEQTEKSFNGISSSVMSIKEDMGRISQKTKKLTELSKNLNAAVENISAVTEETSAGAQEVNANVQEQTFSTGLINERVLEFNKKISRISEEMKKFKYIKIAHREYDDSIIQFEVFKEFVRRKLGLAVEGIQVPAVELFKSVADGSVDGTLAPWLPVSGDAFLKKYGEDIENLGPNMHGCKYGIVVPKYVTINEIQEMQGHEKKFDNKIYSIERKTFVGSLAVETVEQYKLDGFEVVFGNEESMIEMLSKKYKNKEWVAVTGWQPHWKFGVYDLKFLDDPRGILGQEEYTATLVRKGLSEENIELYRAFKEFKIDIAELNTAVSKVHNGMSHEKAAMELVDSLLKAKISQ